ncbi:MAG: class I SAM-dependent methyltransferase, partial [Methylocella sp.]
MKDPVSTAMSLTGELFFRVRRDGLFRTAAKGLRYLWHDRSAFDRKYGTDTGRIEPLWRLDIRSASLPFANRYETAGEEVIETAIRHLGLKNSEFTFIDLGCGKGLPLLVAARLGFAEIIGVEFAPKLAVIARSNAEIMGIKNISVLDMDAGEFRFPSSNIVLFLFNPFGDHVTEKVLDNLNHQIEQVSHTIVRPPLYIIYGNPGALLDRCGFLIKLDTLRVGKWPIAIYQR